jgi:CBS domain-containing protein
MRAMDVMTTDVITVDPDTTVQSLATLLAERGISGAPVVDSDGRLVGVISEGDLLHRAEIGTARRHRVRRRSWWLDHFASDLAREYVKSHGRTVKEIMTRDVVTVTEDTELAEVAALLEAKRIKRVPVMREGKIVGIISRANIVRAVGATKGTPPREGEGDDRSIRARLLAELGREEWAQVWPEDIIVHDGIVHFWISEDEPSEKRQALRVAAETIAGVRGVEEHVVPAPVVPAF